jgi:hypothetical protein
MSLSRYLTIASLCLIVCAAGCMIRPHFVVRRGDPSYRLEAPDHHEIPFSDILQNYDGYQPGHAWIDLRPLMELRIENAYYEPGAARTGLTGYLGTEVAQYLVARHNLQLLAVRPMAQRPSRDQPVQDLISPQNTRFAYYRLYYEIVFARSSQSHGSVLLGADSMPEIEHLASALAHPENVCYPGAPHCIVFPEACSVSVEMKIIANGKAQSVVWGTVLGSLIKDGMHGVRMKRLRGSQPVPVQIDGRDPKALLLPLLPGDEIYWD